MSIYSSLRRGKLMKRLRFTTVGAGFWSHYQLAAWQELPGVQCIAVCDRDRLRAEKLAASRGVPAVYADVAQMIEQERPDFLDIVTDVASHVPLVKLAAGMKVPVICQKPMALTLGEYFGEASTVYCRTARVHADIRGEDVATAVLGMNDGRTTVAVNMAYAGTPLEHECFPETLVFVEGDRGSVEVTPGCRVRVTTQTGTHVAHVRPPKFAWTDPEYAVVQASMVACQTDLVHSLASRIPSETDAADNLRTMRLVFAAYDSAQGAQVVRVGG
jgi:predicted dehydrogenase